MGQALYRKYRSKSLDEVVGQDHITDTLRKALKSGRISHAYLFTGPRGVGKTSIARILAHEINGLPYDEGKTHIDIIEIDAASNRRIDEIRDLRDKVYIAPAIAKYKVYIIDEVHMLTKEAFNALLKTLEEPPAHAVFILATTESHKLPDTIISRTQRYVFRPIEQSKAVGHLREIADKEKIDISDEALGLIAEHGDGSFRDSISLLDQAGSHGTHVDLVTVQTMLGIPPEQATDQLLQLVQRGGDVSTLMAQLNALYDQGFQAASIAKHLSRTLREQVIANASPVDTANAAQLLEKLLEIPVSHNPERYLEIVLMQVLTPTSQFKAPSAEATQPVDPILEPTLPKATKLLPSENTVVEKLVKKLAAQESPTEAKKEVVTEQKLAKTKAAAPGALLDESNWPQVLAILKKQYNTLYGIVRMAKPDFSEAGKVDLVFAFAFHQKRAHEAKNLQAISAAVIEVTGNTLEITCSFDPDLKLVNKNPTDDSGLPDLPHAKDAVEPLSAISNIFGGGELI